MILTGFAILVMAVLQHQPTVPRPVAHRNYVLGGPMLTAQGAGAIYHRVSPPLSGAGVGFLIAGGRALTPRFALEGELNVGADISTAQHFSYFITADYIHHNRDITATGQVRFSAGPLDLVAGAGAAFARSQETDYVDQAGFRSDKLCCSVLRTPALVYGVDVPLSKRDKVQIVPTFRGRIIRRIDFSQDYLGASAYVFHGGVTVRFRW